MKNKKLIVFQTFPRWLPQTQTWIYNQVKFLSDKIDCHIICDTTENLDQFHMPNIHSSEEKFRYYPIIMRLIRNLGIQNNNFLVYQAKSKGAKLLHSHFGNFGWFDLKAAKKAGLKHIVTFYGHDVNYFPIHKPKWKSRYLELFNDADLFLCEGPHMADCLMKLGCPDNKVKVHHLGIDLDNFPFLPRKWNSSEPLRVLIAASFSEKKGIPYALEALGRFQNEGPIEITIIGDAQKVNAEKRKILATIEKYNLQSKIRMLGYQPYSVLIEEAYKHHVFLSPSVTASSGDTEGGAPVTIIEMAASGMPIISTTHCDIPEVIIHNKTGLLAAERDVESLILHLRWLTRYPEQWNKMLNQGRKHIETQYDARQQGQKLSEIYCEFTGGDRLV